MASFCYIPAKKYLWDGTIDLDTHDIRIALVMTNSTADTDNTAALMNAFGTLDEMDGAGYARIALTGEAVNQDTPNVRAEFDANDVTFTGISNGTRQVQGTILFNFVTNDADSIPIFYIDFGSTINPGGGTINVVWDAQGIAQHT